MSDLPHQPIGTQPIQQLQRQLMARISEALPQEAFSTSDKYHAQQLQSPVVSPLPSCDWNFLLQLAAHKIRIILPDSQQFTMRAPFRNLPLIQHKNEIGVANGETQRQKCVLQVK